MLNASADMRCDVECDNEPAMPVAPAGSRAHELTHLLEFQPVADGSSFGAAVLAAAAAST